MQKIIFLVDAENVPFEIFKRYYAEVEPVQGVYEVVSKVYGSHAVLGNILTSYYEKGFEYVETSSLSFNTKNVADMKMCVDCAELVFRTYAGEVSYVYILSRDSDFLPLVYKLESVGIEVRTAIKNIHLTKSDKPKILKRLKLVGFLPITAEDSLRCVFDAVKQALPEEYDDKDIEKFVNVRISLFIGSAANKGWDVSNVQKLEIKNITFDEVARSIDLSQYSELVELYGIYSRKVFGSIPKKDSITPYLRKIWGDIRGTI